MLKINIITLFPEYFDSILNTGLLAKAITNNLLEINLVQLRDFAINDYGKVDDSPYGGGAGMVLKPEPIYDALESLAEKGFLVALSPRGFTLEQTMLRSTITKVTTSFNNTITLICGHYEGIDERILQLCNLSISVGDYILSGGEPAAVILIDAISRLIPGYMSNSQSTVEESFEKENYIEHAQYTRPQNFMSHEVPTVLLSGNHKLIEKWRKENSTEAIHKFKLKSLH